MEGIELKTWEDVCQVLNLDPVESLKPFDGLADDDQKASIAFFKLSKLSKAAYAGKQPDWSSEKEYKWFPYFDMDDDEDAPGFGFSYANCDHWLTRTGVGSRLVFPSREMARHAGTQFIDWYRDMMVLPK